MAYWMPAFAGMTINGSLIVPRQSALIAMKHRR
jgi:hypothetical protein